MNKNTLTFLAAAMFCGGNHVLAADSPEAATTKEPAAYHPFSLTVEAGTTGAGGSASWRFWDHLGLRGGADYFEYTDNDRDIEGITYDTKLKVVSEPVTLDLYPWTKRSFHFRLGVAFNQSEVTGVGTPSGNVTIGGSTYTPTQVGTLTLNVKPQEVTPYLSVAGNFFYFDKAHHWAFGGELGVMYTGDARVALSASNGGVSQSDIDNERQQIEDKLNDVKFWPVLKLAVTYSF